MRFPQLLCRFPWLALLVKSPVPEEGVEGRMVGLGLLQDPEFDPFEVAQVLIVAAYAQGFLSGAQSVGMVVDACCMLLCQFSLKP